jgi:hypothetical protein
MLLNGLVDFAVAEFFGTSARYSDACRADGYAAAYSEVRSLASMLGAAGLPAMRRFSGPGR